MQLKYFTKFHRKKNLVFLILQVIKVFLDTQFFSKIYKEYIKMKRRDVKLVKCKFNDLNKNYEKWPLNTSMKMKKVKKFSI